MAKNPQPLPAATPAAAAAPDNITAAGIQQLRELLGLYSRNVPPGAARMYEAKPGDTFSDSVIGVPDGRYRIHGSDWVLSIADEKFTAAVRAVPPHFGGTGVVEVTDNNAVMPAPAPEIDEKQLAAEGWLSPDQVKALKHKIDDLCREPQTMGDPINTPNPKFTARLVQVAVLAGVDVDKDAIAQADKVLAGDK